MGARRAGDVTGRYLRCCAVRRGWRWGGGGGEGGIGLRSAPKMTGEPDPSQRPENSRTMSLTPRDRVLN